MITLSSNAIFNMCNKNNQQYTVQVMDCKKMQTTKRITCYLSDGYYMVRAFMGQNQLITQDDNLAIIHIRNYSILEQHDKIYAILIHQCKLQNIYSEKIGKPIDIMQQKEPKIRQQGTQHLKLDPSKLKYPQNKDKISQNKAENEQKQQQKNIPQITIKQIAQINLDDNERISDLDPELPNWQLAAKIVKKSYKEFTSKQGKQTKVLNIQLMDRTGAIICAAMFGQDAIKYYNSLKQQNLYLLSRGKVREDGYSHKKSKFHSKYSILLTMESQFKRIKNSEIAIDPSQKYHNLKQILFSNQSIQSLDIVAILLSVEPQMDFQKGGKVLKKQAIEICDPQNKISMEVTIWNKKIIIEPSMIGKTIVLSGFKLYNFNQRLTLNSSYNSFLKVLSNHPYCRYQGSIQKSEIQAISEGKKAIADNQEPCRNLKQLDQQIQYLEKGNQIKSSLNLFLTVINSKNWSYESCPNCRKSAEPFTYCNYCSKQISQTVPRYRINVQMSDCTGSIWGTGFEQFGCKLFEDIPEGIYFLKKLEENQRQKYFQKDLFKQFKVKITSKLDDFSNVKHTITKISSPEMMPLIADNIYRIKEHIGF